MEAFASYFKGDNMDLPRNLYKSPGIITFNATKTYDTIVVENMEEYKAGIEAGYIDSFSDALNGIVAGEFEIIEDVDEAAKKAASLAKRRATIAKNKAKAESEAEEIVGEDKEDKEDKEDFDDF